MERHWTGTLVVGGAFVGVVAVRGHTSWAREDDRAVLWVRSCPRAFVLGRFPPAITPPVERHWRSERRHEIFGERDRFLAAGEDFLTCGAALRVFVVAHADHRRLRLTDGELFAARGWFTAQVADRVVLVAVDVPDVTVGIPRIAQHPVMVPGPRVVTGDTDWAHGHDERSVLDLIFRCPAGELGTFFIGPVSFWDVADFDDTPRLVVVGHEVTHGGALDRVSVVGTPLATSRHHGTPR